MGSGIPAENWNRSVRFSGWRPWGWCCCNIAARYEHCQLPATGSIYRYEVACSFTKQALLTTLYHALFLKSIQVQCEMSLTMGSIDMN
jgi:hypothetical protein